MKLSGSEQLFETIVQNISEPVLFMNKDFKILWANKAFQNQTGYKIEEIIGNHCYRITHHSETPCKSPNHLCPVVESQKTGKVATVTHTHFDKKGNELFVEIIVYPVKDKGGNTTQFVYIYRDVTEHYRDEKALRTSEEKCRTIVDNAGEAIIVAQEGMLKFANPKTTVITGYSIGELTSKKFLEFIHPDDRALVFKRYSYRIGGAKVPGVYPFRIVDKEGNYRWVEINAVRIDWEGKPATLNFLTEITKRKQAEDQLLIKNHAIGSSINAIAFSDLEATLTYANNSFLRLWGYSDETEVIGRPAWDFWQRKEEALKIVESLYEDDRGSWIGELTAKRKDGSLFNAQISASLVRDENGKPLCIMGSFLDITKRKQTEQSLREREMDLAIQTNNLEEINAALNVLLKKREADKTELEEKIIKNIQQLIEPYIAKLKQSGLDERQKALTAILESNLKDITSSFAYSFSSPLLQLTPKEINIANLIKLGKSTKEICELLGSSEKAVSFHRGNIRRKLGLQNGKMNLKSYLMAKVLK